MKEKITFKLKNYFKKQDSSIFAINLYESIDKKVSLKELLKENLRGAINPENFRIKLILGDFVKVDLVDDLLSLGINTSSLEVVLNKESSLSYYFKVCDCFRFIDFEEVSGEKLKDEEINKKLSFDFLGEGSSAKIRCFCQGTDRRTFKFETLQNHKASNSKSDLVIKAALCHESKIVSDNLIKVDQEAKNVEAVQLNKNLLLGCNSRALCIPKLEVESDDVNCKHGAAVSELNEEQIFYLQSRGFNSCQAKKYLVNAFLS